MEVERFEAKVKPRTRNVKMRKPKAREPNKSEMSLEEENTLRLESLPEENMHSVLQIVRKRNINLEMLGDEIELDIDEMDVETQWELDRFVTNFNKALKKSQRAAMMNGGVADVTSAAVAEDDTAPVGHVPALVDNDDAVMTIGATHSFLVAASGCVNWALMVVCLFTIFTGE